MTRTDGALAPREADVLRVARAIAANHACDWPCHPPEPGKPDHCDCQVDARAAIAALSEGRR